MGSIHRVEEDIEEKYCPKCQEWWPATREFFYSGNESDGLHCYCVDCFLNYRRARLGQRPSVKERRYHRFDDIKDPIVTLREAGKTFPEIGELWDISKQRASQVYHMAMAERG